MNKKGQAALEFLMTYGWAILVVLVVIGALAYFGILNPSILLPEKCTLQMGLYCKDHRIDAPSQMIFLKLENGMGKDMMMDSITITGDVLEDGCYTGVGNYTAESGGVAGCDDTPTCASYDNYSEWPLAPAGCWRGCNPFEDFRQVYNRNVGLWLPQGRAVDVEIYCPARPLMWTGKVKNTIDIQWYFADSDQTYMHTMLGELLATVEQE